MNQKDNSMVPHKALERLAEALARHTCPRFMVRGWCQRKDCPLYHGRKHNTRSEWALAKECLMRWAEHG